MNAYVMILVADLLFAMQFLFTKLYQEQGKDHLSIALNYSMGCNAAMGLIALCALGFKVEITGFSLLMATLMAGTSAICSYFSIASLKYVNLSLYSVFLMLGGMLLPFLYGLIFLSESLTVGKVVCVALIAGAMALSVQKGTAKKGAAKYYIAIFLLNGISSVFSKIHQDFPEINTSTTNVLFLTCAVDVILCAVVIALRGGRAGFVPVTKPKNWACMVGYAVVHGIAQFLSMQAMLYLPATVQFSLLSGGVILFSTLISIVRREKQTWRTILSVGLALAALIVVGL